MNKTIALLISSITALVLLPTVPANAGHANTATGLPYGGVAVHIGYFGTVYGDATLIGNTLKTAEAKWVRTDGPGIGQSQGYYDRYYADVREVHRISGAKLMMIANRADQDAKAQVDVMAPLITDGIVKAVEGSNEWDDDNAHISGWEVQIREHQKALWREVTTRFSDVQVIGPSLSLSKTGSIVGDLSPYMHVGNFHYYARHTGIDTRDLSARWADKAIVAGWADGSGDPMIVTEANGIFGCEDPYAGSTEESQRLGMIDLYSLLAKQAYGGAHRVFAYELLNGTFLHKFPECHSENNYGLFRKNSDGTWTAKPVFFPVRDANRRG